MNFLYIENENNIIGWAENETAVKLAVPSGIGYYLYTENDVPKDGSGNFQPPEVWEIEGDPDGYGMTEEERQAYYEEKTENENNNEQSEVDGVEQPEEATGNIDPIE